MNCHPIKKLATTDFCRKRVKEARGLQDYLKYLKIALYLKGLDVLGDMTPTMTETNKIIYESFFTYANRPNLFNDLKTIIEINQLHSDLYEWSTLVKFDHK